MTALLPRRRFVLSALCAGLLPAAASAAGGQRIALVVGNGGYGRLPLRNAVNDAQDMGQALQQCGFDVTVKRDLDWDGSVSALDDFTRRAPSCDVRLFYYAGHGMQIDGRSYLNPIGPFPANEHELRSRAIELEPLITQLSHLSAGVSILIVDACRSNPYLDAMARRTRGIGTRPGVAALQAPRGVVVAFATGPEGNAQDGLPSQANGTFTHFLLREMKSPGATIDSVLKRVRAEVDAASSHQQQPWVSTNLVGDFCFLAGPGGRCGEGA